MALHGLQGVVHGDLTSWNVLLDLSAKSTLLTPKVRAPLPAAPGLLTRMRVAHAACAPRLF